MATKGQEPQALVIGYIAHRNLLGLLGFLFPFILILGGFILGNCGPEIQPSISAYYHTIMRNVFVGILFAFSFFLFTYWGYNFWDRVACWSAGACALGVAIFPTEAPYRARILADGSLEKLYSNCIVPPYIDLAWINTAHLTCAVLFFLITTIISLFLFTKSDTPKDQWDAAKKRRNRIYIACGIVMFTSIIAIAVYLLIKEDYPELSGYDPVFWCEAFALMAFGISWLTKGEFLGTVTQAFQAQA